MNNEYSGDLGAGCCKVLRQSRVYPSPIAGKAHQSVKTKKKTQSCKASKD